MMLKIKRNVIAATLAFAMLTLAPRRATGTTPGHWRRQRLA